MDWTPWTAIAGRLAPELLDGFLRNRWTESPEYAIGCRTPGDRRASRPRFLPPPPAAPLPQPSTTAASTSTLDQAPTPRHYRIVLTSRNTRGPLRSRSLGKAERFLQVMQRPRHSSSGAGRSMSRAYLQPASRIRIPTVDLVAVPFLLQIQQVILTHKQALEAPQVTIPADQHITVSKELLCTGRVKNRLAVDM